jgi:hypothetical protein
VTTWSKTSGGRPGFQPSTDERTGTRACGEVPATKGDEVQRVLRWCKVLHVYLPACGASAHPKRRRRRWGAARRGSREGSYSSWCTLILIPDSGHEYLILTTVLGYQAPHLPLACCCLGTAFGSLRHHTQKSPVLNVRNGPFGFV